MYKCKGTTFIYMGYVCICHVWITDYLVLGDLNTKTVNNDKRNGPLIRARLKVTFKNLLVSLF